MVFFLNHVTSRVRVGLALIFYEAVLYGRLFGGSFVSSKSFVQKLLRFKKTVFFHFWAFPVGGVTSSNYFIYLFIFFKRGSCRESIETNLKVI